MKRLGLLAALIVSVFCCCENGGAGKQVDADDGTLYDKEGYTVKGRVSCNGEAVAGVVVSDGVNVTKSDKYGRYWLPADIAASDFVMISIPSGYEVASDDRYSLLPMFYGRIDRDCSDVQQFDFELSRVDNDDYALFVFADMHLSGRDPSSESFSTSDAPLDFTQYETLLVPHAKAYADDLTTRVYGVNLGDMTHSQYWYSNNACFEQYLEATRGIGFQMFNVIGNHDHDHKTMDDYGAAERYRSVLGPTYYSFNLGRQHYVVLDNMICTDGDNSNGYDTSVDDVQVRWLKQDLEAMDQSVEDVVILCHVPFANWKTSGTTSNVQYNKVMGNFDELAAALDGYDVTIMSGHSHLSQAFRINERMVQYTHPSVCGTWWYELLCTDGTPAAYTVYRFSGRDMMRHVVPFGEKYRDRKYTLYNEDVTTQTGWYQTGEDETDESTGYDKALLLNCWEWNPGWTIKVFENGKEMSGRGEMVWRCDLDHRRMCMEEGIVPYGKYSWLKTKRNLHMFQYVPDDPASLITIMANDETGSPRFVVNNVEIR